MPREMVRRSVCLFLLIAVLLALPAAAQPREPGLDRLLPFWERLASFLDFLWAEIVLDTPGDTGTDSGDTPPPDPDGGIHIDPDG